VPPVLSGFGEGPD